MSPSLLLLISAVPIVVGLVALSTGAIHLHDGHRWWSIHRAQEPVAYWLWVSFTILIGLVLVAMGVVRMMR